jgi:two-component system NtrC family response regulator/two-component system nitrogen regulation response regulator GlnG
MGAKQRKPVKMSVMLVEDDELFRDAIKDFVSTEYEVIEAESAEVALELFQQNLPDLVLLDITLPGMDGLELLKKIKATWSDLPVIMVTAMDAVPRVVESIKLDAFDYLTKPINPEMLMEKIDQALRESDAKS